MSTQTASSVGTKRKRLAAEEPPPAKRARVDVPRPTFRPRLFLVTGFWHHAKGRAPAPIPPLWTTPDAAGLADYKLALVAAHEAAVVALRKEAGARGTAAVAAHGATNLATQPLTYDAVVASHEKGGRCTLHTTCTHMGAMRSTITVGTKGLAAAFAAPTGG